MANDENTIFECCKRNNTKGLERIIRLGADIHQEDNDGITPCDFIQNVFLRKEMKECLCFLMEMGGDIHQKDHNGKTPLDYIENPSLKKEMEEYANICSTLDIKEPTC